MWGSPPASYGVAARALLGLTLLLLSEGCAVFDEPPRPTPTLARPVATLAYNRPAPLATEAPTVTRAVPTRTPTPPAEDDSEIERSVAEARARVERLVGSAALPGVEDLLMDTVALATPSGGDQLARAAAARWLRQRATGSIRIVDFQRHQHQALIVATTQGWAALAPSTTSELGFTLRRYDAAGTQDPEHGTWRIDVIEAN